MAGSRTTSRPRRITLSGDDHRGVDLRREVGPGILPSGALAAGRTTPRRQTDDDVVPTGSVRLSWVAARNATLHRIYLGTGGRRHSSRRPGENSYTVTGLDPARDVSLERLRGVRYRGRCEESPGLSGPLRIPRRSIVVTQCVGVTAGPRAGRRRLGPAPRRHRRGGPGGTVDPRSLRA